MQFSFDFVANGSRAAATGIGTSASNMADGVTFTVSGDADGGLEQIVFGNTSVPSVPLLIDDFGADDQFILTFQSMANPLNTRIDGTASNPIQLKWGLVQGNWKIAFETAGGGTTAPTGSDFVITAGEDNQSLEFVGTGITGVVFTSTDGAAFASMVVTSLSGDDFNCFCSGTRIATPEGEVKVETLVPGDKVLTADGNVSTVQWLGRQDVGVRMSNPGKINPICISAGALGENIPARDLWVSMDHAIGIGGYLVNAGVLVNGSTIYQVAQMPLDGFTYYHIETDAHELLLAEGCPAESFVDYASLGSFDNANQRDGSAVYEMPLPRISASRMLPKTIKTRIAARIPHVAA